MEHNAQSLTRLSSRQLDPLGRIAIPEYIWTALGWRPGQRLVIRADDSGDAVLIRPELSRCSICLSECEDLLAFKRGYICPQCRRELMSGL